MRKKNSHTNSEVLRLCRDINKRADDLEKLQPLVFRLNRVLSEANSKPRIVEVSARPREENPFDKILAEHGARRHEVTI